MLNFALSVCQLTVRAASISLMKFKKKKKVIIRHKYRFLHPAQSVCQRSSSTHPHNAGSFHARNSTVLTVCNSQRLCSDHSGSPSAVRVSLATHKVTLSFMAQKGKIEQMCAEATGRPPPI